MRWPTPVKVICPWRLKASFVREGVAFYAGRVERYVPFSLEERRPAPPKGRRLEDLKEAEAKILLQALPPRGVVVALDERGKSYRSEDWARWLGRVLEEREALVFLIGGAYGLADKVLRRADRRLSLSSFTLGHELALLVLLEQLYRAFTILSGEPYHK